MQVLRGIPALSRGLEFPFQLTGACVNGVEIAIVCAEVDHSIRHGWRRNYTALDGKLPFLCPGFERKRIQISIRAAHVDGSIRDCRSGDHETVGVKLPLDGGEFCHSRCVVNSSVLRVATKHSWIQG